MWIFAPRSVFGLSAKSRWRSGVGKPAAQLGVPDDGSGSPPGAHPSSNNERCSGAGNGFGPARIWRSAAIVLSKDRLRARREDHLYDDFTDWAPDEPPPHWKVRGPAVQLRMGGGIRELFMPDGCNPELTSPPIKVPQNFTFELDMMATGGELNIDFLNAKGEGNSLAGHFAGEEDTANIHLNRPSENIGNGETKKQPNELLKFAIWIQQGHARAYINGERVVDSNQVELESISRLVINHRWKDVGIRRIRIAEFAPVLKLIANGLIKNPASNDTTDGRAQNRRVELVKQ